jgi:hypothetical protein
MRIYDKIVESPFEPQSTSVIWLKPTGDGFSFYRHINGHWEALKIMDDKGTATPDDDTEIDTTDMPTKETVQEMIEEEVTEQIGTQVEEEVTRQMDTHDKQVGDVHYEESSDPGEYPDYSDII